MNSSNNITALVLGANGFIGQNLCLWLQQQGFTVIASDLGDTFAGATYMDGEVPYIKANLTDTAQANQLPLQQADLIFVMAGLTGTAAGFSQYAAYVGSNEMALLNVLHAYTQQQAVGRIIFPSTRLVYKGVKNYLLAEDAEKESKTVYAVNKLACEQYLWAWANAYHVRYTIFRICVPYGQLLPGPYSFGTLGFMLRQAREKGVIELYGDGSQRRTFTHVADLCTIMTQAALLPHTQDCTFNIGSHDHLSLKELAELVAQKTGATIAFKPWPELDKAIESGDTMFDDSLLQSQFPCGYTGKIEAYIQSL